MYLQFELSYVRLGGREAEEALPYGNFFAKKRIQAQERHSFDRMAVGQSVGRCRRFYYLSNIKITHAA